jgi:hypothetical protein
MLNFITNDFVAKNCEKTGEHLPKFQALKFFNGPLEFSHASAAKT